jgi:hypothetical protein
MVTAVDALATLAAAGFDIAHTFDAAAAAREPGLAALAGRGRLGILIGNTRALWPKFLAAHRIIAQCRSARALHRADDRSCVSRRGLLRHLATPFPVSAANRRHWPERALLNHLVIHPIYGPWFALRAVVVTDGDPPGRRPIAQPCQCNAACRERFERAQQSMEPDDWLAVRDACSLRSWRYTDEQVRYHYSRMLRQVP